MNFSRFSRKPVIVVSDGKEAQIVPDGGDGYNVVLNGATIGTVFSRLSTASQKVYIGKVTTVELPACKKLSEAGLNVLEVYLFFRKVSLTEEEV